MLKRSLNEALRLVMRSKVECLVYLLAVVLSETGVAAAYKWLGVDYPSYAPGLGTAQLIRLAALSTPALFITAWFGAGLTGRISMDASKGQPASMASYANGWFIRNLAGMIIISSAAFLPVIFLMVLPKIPAAFLMLAWFLFFIWLAIRVSLWANIMFIEGLGPAAAMQQSYRVTEGYVAQLVLLSLPLFVRMVWGTAALYLPSGNIVLTGVLKNLLIGLATLIQVGALATVYLTIKRGSATIKES